MSSSKRRSNPTGHARGGAGNHPALAPASWPGPDSDAFVVALRLSTNARPDGFAMLSLAPDLLPQARGEVGDASPPCPRGKAGVGVLLGTGRAMASCECRSRL